MKQTIQVAIVGVTGYTGMELIRLLGNHPVFELRVATSRREAGKRLQDIYPHLIGLKPGAMTIDPPDPEHIAKKCSLVFLAVPHGTAMDMAATLCQKGLKVVDLSADFRIRSRETYEKWYAQDHSCPHLLGEAVYGLVELYQEEIRQTKLVANPGCYPSSIILGLYPALARGLIDTESLVIDSKSGATGAGRGAREEKLFCEVQDNFRAYALGGAHRHTPEVEQELSRYAGREITVSFNPHLLPVNRGILSTMYAGLKPGVSLQQIRQAYTDSYRNHEWIRILDPGVLPQIKNVRGTMLCDLGLVLDERTRRLIVVSAIDNLCRGASGQALANANLMSGLEVSAGLDLAPLVP
ncbi:MAG: N-acetyl-gamma-glutamyl-phosphate reductase [Thermodesulfobacteriota bacterium]